jgi:hypothetical protein
MGILGVEVTFYDIDMIVNLSYLMIFRVTNKKQRNMHFEESTKRLFRFSITYAILLVKQV